MAEANVTMTGSWIAVAGEGYATVTPRIGFGNVEWAASSAGAPAVSYWGGVLKNNEDRSFQISVGEQLYLRAPSGYIVRVYRETEPV